MSLRMVEKRRRWGGGYGCLVKSEEILSEVVENRGYHFLPRFSLLQTIFLFFFGGVGVLDGLD